ncbi:fibronectin type III domain-containing protein [Lentisphaerota bacterium WC36G]
MNACSFYDCTISINTSSSKYKSLSLRNSNTTVHQTANNTVFFLYGGTFELKDNVNISSLDVYNGDIILSNSHVEDITFWDQEESTTANITGSGTIGNMYCANNSEGNVNVTIDGDFQLEGGVNIRNVTFNSSSTINLDGEDDSLYLRGNNTILNSEINLSNGTDLFISGALNNLDGITISNGGGLYFDNIYSGYEQPILVDINGVTTDKYMVRLSNFDYAEYKLAGNANSFDKEVVLKLDNQVKETLSVGDTYLRNGKDVELVIKDNILTLEISENLFDNVEDGDLILWTMDEGAPLVDYYIFSMSKYEDFSKSRTETITSNMTKAVDTNQFFSKTGAYYYKIEAFDSDGSLIETYKSVTYHEGLSYFTLIEGDRATGEKAVGTEGIGIYIEVNNKGELVSSNYDTNVRIDVSNNSSITYSTLDNNCNVYLYHNSSASNLKILNSCSIRTDKTSSASSIELSGEYDYWTNDARASFICSGNANDILIKVGFAHFKDEGNVNGVTITGWKSYAKFEDVTASNININSSSDAFFKGKTNAQQITSNNANIYISEQAHISDINVDNSQIEIIDYAEISDLNILNSDSLYLEDNSSITNINTSESTLFFKNNSKVTNLDSSNSTIYLKDNASLDGAKLKNNSLLKVYNTKVKGLLYVEDSSIETANDYGNNHYLKKVEGDILLTNNADLSQSVINLYDNSSIVINGEHNKFGKVNFKGNGFINFDITSIDETSTNFMIDGFSQGYDEIERVGLVIDGNIEYGTYELASGINENNDYFEYSSLYVFDDYGNELGSLSLNTNYSSSQRTYDLYLDDGSVKLNVREDLSVSSPYSLQYDDKCIWQHGGDESGIKKYILEYSKNADFSGESVTIDCSDNYCYGRSIYGSYYVRVKAIDNADNESDWSESKFMNFEDNQAPTTVTDIKLNNKNVISWTPSEDSMTGMKEYQLEYSKYSNFSNSSTYKSSSNSFDSLQLYGNYYIRIKAIDNVGNESGWSSSTRLGFRDLISPEVPQNFSIDNTNVLSWSKVIDQGIGFKKYIFEYSKNSDFSGNSTSVDRFSNFFNGANIYGDYYVRVKTVDFANNESDWSETSAINFKDVINPGEVKNFDVNDKNILSWTPIEDSGSGVKEYIIECYKNNNKTTYITTSNTFEAKELYGNYYIKIITVDNAGNKSDGNFTKMLTFKDLLSPDSPQNISVNDSNILSWSHITDQGTGLNKYILEYSKNADFSDASTIINCHNNFFNGTNLYGDYYIRVKSVDNVGNESDWSETSSVFFNDIVAPGKPYNLEIINGNILSWKKPNEYGSGLKEYILEYSNHADFSNKSTVIVDTNSYNMNGVDLENLYVQVTAVDFAGNKNILNKKIKVSNNNSFENSHQIDINQTTNSWVGFGDALDVHKFTVDTAGCFEIDLTNLDSKTYFNLYKAYDYKDTTRYKKIKGASSKTDKNTGLTAAEIKNLLLDKGEYYVEVISGDKGKGRYETDYDLNINADYFPDATEDEFNFKTGVGTANELTLNDNGDVTTNGWVGFGDALDVHKFTVDTAGCFEIDLTNLDSKTYFNLYKAYDYKDTTRYKKIKGASSKTDKNTGLTAAEIKNLLLDKGEYYVEVISGDKGKGRYETDYDLNINADYFPDATEDEFNFKTGVGTANELTLNDNGDVTTNGWVGFGDALDVHKFTVDTAGCFEIDLTNLDSKTYFNLYKAYDYKDTTRYKKIKGASSKTDKNTGLTAAEIKNLLLDKGEYYVEVISGDKGKGRYETDYDLNINADFYPTTNNWENAVQITEDEFGTTGDFSEIIGMTDKHDYYKFTGVSGAYSLEVTHSIENINDGNLELTLYQIKGGKFVKIASDDLDTITKQIKIPDNENGDWTTEAVEVCQASLVNKGSKEHIYLTPGAEYLIDVEYTGNNPNENLEYHLTVMS